MLPDQDLVTVSQRLRDVLGDARGKIRVADALLVAGFERRTQLRAELVGLAMRQLGWERCRCRFDGSLESAFSRGSALEREAILEVARGKNSGVLVLTRRAP